MFDQASSAMAHGDVQVAAREARALPPDTGVDANGMPTTDPQTVLDANVERPELRQFGGEPFDDIVADRGCY